jgi:tellurite resistance protein TerA
MTLRKGENAALPTAVVRLEFGRSQGEGVPRADACAVLLADGRAADGGRAVVHAGAPLHDSGAVRFDGSTLDDGFAVDTLAVDLGSVPAEVTSVLILARGDGGAFGDLPGMWVRVRIGSGSTEIARYDCADATRETAYVLGECYRRSGGWRFRAVGQGYDTGLAGLAAAHGLGPDEMPALPAVPAGPVRAWAPPRPSRVTLTKQAPAVSLAEQGGTSGALSVGLNWQAAHGRRGGAGTVDLDLCALFELSDGSKGVVQALGGAFGALDRPPFVLLDADDRTGGGGENVTVNLDRAASFRRVLFFVTIYQGARSFAGLHATVRLRPDRGADIDFALDECTVPSTVCALALLVRDGPDLVVRREARYLVPRRGVSPQRTVDYAYGWGLAWTPGRK